MTAVSSDLFPHSVSQQGECDPVTSRTQVNASSQPSPFELREKPRRKKTHWLDKSLSPTEFKFPSSSLRGVGIRRTPSPETSKLKAFSTVVENKKNCEKQSSVDYSPLIAEPDKGPKRNHSAFSSFEFPEINRKPAYVTHLHYPRANSLFSDLKQRFSHFHRPGLRPSRQKRAKLQLLPMKEIAGKEGAPRWQGWDSYGSSRPV